MKKKMTFCAVAILAVALGCVIRTEHKIDAHITLDIRHIAEQAESVLDFVEGKSDALPGMADAPEPVSHLRRALYAGGAPAARSFSNSIWERVVLIQVAHADTLKVTTSPLVQEIATSMRERNPRIAALKKQGCLGETNRGYVEVHDCDAIKDAEQRNEAQKLAADENKDRKALYAEIARLNREAMADISVTKVEAIYAREWQRRAQSGESVQLPPAGDDFNEVKGSALGRNLGEKCVPNAWVLIP